MMISALVLLYLIGLMLFLLCRVTSEEHYKNFERTGQRPFRYWGTTKKYPRWLNVMSGFSIVLLIGSAGLALVLISL